MLPTITMKSHDASMRIYHTARSACLDLFKLLKGIVQLKQTA